MATHNNRGKPIDRVHPVPFERRYDPASIESLGIAAFTLTSRRHGPQLWSLAAKVNAAAQVCCRCSTAFPSLTERLYRPTTNTYNRMDRVCSKCVEALNAAKGQA